MKGVVRIEVEVACDPRTGYECKGGECLFVWVDSNEYGYCCHHDGRAGCDNDIARAAADQLAAQDLKEGEV